MIYGRLKSLMTYCPYTRLWGVTRDVITTKKLPESARPGALIALLGLFCPLFWIALFTGASRSELMFHATHSGVVCGIGLLLMIAGWRKEKQQSEHNQQ